ncbi:MAG: hypothetical protein V3V12_05280, partial [Gammaproteobacteria bacterium]
MGGFLIGLLFYGGCLVGVIVNSPQVYAEQKVLPRIADLVPQFSFSTGAAQPIIEYTLNHAMLAEQDSTPLLQVFGNGLVKVHYPVYMKKAGDYEQMLTPDELKNLLASLSDNGLMEFNPEAVRHYKKQTDQQQRLSGGALYNISDTTETNITIRLDAYQRNKFSGKVTNMLRQFSWKNLEHDARRYPQSSDIQGALSGEKRLRQLMNHPQLRRV